MVPDVVYICNIMVTIFQYPGSDFEEAIKQNSYSVMVEVAFNIITDKNVITKCKCRAKCYGDNCANQITWKDEDSMVFFYGHSIANANRIKVAGEMVKDS